MNKDRIRKYLIATIAMMLTFAVVYVVFGMNKNDAYASTTGTLKWDVTVTPDIKVNGTTDSTITPTSCSYEYEVRKTGESSALHSDTASGSPIIGQKANVDTDATYKIVLTSCSVTIDGTTYNATGTCETELTGTGESDRTGTLTPEINITRRTLKWSVTVTPDIKVNGTSDSSISPTSCSYGYEVRKTGESSALHSDTASGSPITGEKANVDTDATYKLVLTSCSVTIDGTTYNATTPIETNLTGTDENIRTGTLAPEINIPRGTLSWSVTVTPTVQVNGQLKSPTSCSYQYEVKKTDGSSIYTGTASSSPITESKDNVDTNAAYKLVLKSCNVTVDAKSYTVTLTNETNLTGTGTATRTGTISPVINVTTKPSSYSKLKSASVKNEDEDYIEVSKLDDSDRNAILDYVYDNNINGLKSVIQDIMSAGSELSIKVVAKKLDSSDVESDVKKDLKKEAQKPSGAGNADILRYYDISVYITKDGTENKSWKITDVGSENKLKVTMKAKSSSSSSGKRYYMALIYHSGDADNLTDYDTSNSITVKTHKFSTYAMSYYDSSSSSSTATNPASNSAIVPGGGGTDPGAAGGGTDKSKTPKTGDNFDPKIWIYLLIVGATVASAAWILLQDTKDDRKSGTGSKQ